MAHIIFIYIAWYSRIYEINSIHVFSKDLVLYYDNLNWLLKKFASPPPDVKAKDVIEVKFDKDRINELVNSDRTKINRLNKKHKTYDKTDILSRSEHSKQRLIYPRFRSLKEKDSELNI